MINENSQKTWILLAIGCERFHRFLNDVFTDLHFTVIVLGLLADVWVWLEVELFRTEQK